MAVDERAERFASALGFPGGDRNGGTIAEPDIAVDIPWTQRFLEPGGLVFGELLRTAQSRARVPDATGVDQQRVVRPHSFTRAADKFQIELFALAHRFPAKFHRAISSFDPLPGDVPRLGSVASKENAGVGLDAA